MDSRFRGNDNGARGIRFLGMTSGNKKARLLAGPFALSVTEVWVPLELSEGLSRGPGSVRRLGRRIRHWSAGRGRGWLAGHRTAGLWFAGRGTLLRAVVLSGASRRPSPRSGPPRSALAFRPPPLAAVALFPFPSLAAFVHLFFPGGKLLGGKDGLHPAIMVFLFLFLKFADLFGEFLQA